MRLNSSGCQLCAQASEPTGQSDFVGRRTCRRLTGSMPVVGSSRKTIAGSPSSAIATERRRFMPPEYAPLRTCAASVRLTCTASEHFMPDLNFHVS